MNPTFKIDTRHCCFSNDMQITLYHSSIMTVRYDNIFLHIIAQPIAIPLKSITLNTNKNIGI